MSPRWSYAVIASTQGQVTQCEPIYSTQYSCEGLPADWLAMWEAPAQSALHLPEPNPFIPTDFQLLQVRHLGCRHCPD